MTELKIKKVYRETYNGQRGQHLTYSFDVETQCPNCSNVWERREDWKVPFGVLILSMCPECNKEPAILVGNNKIWKE